MKKEIFNTKRRYRCDGNVGRYTASSANSNLSEILDIQSELRDTISWQY